MSDDGYDAMNEYICVNIKTMKRSVYKVNVFDDCNYFIAAYSWEHAIIELTRNNPEGFIAFQVEGFTEKNIKTLSELEMEDEFIEYIYPKDEKRVVNISELIDELGCNFYGILGDDFISF